MFSLFFLFFFFFFSFLLLYAKVVKKNIFWKRLMWYCESILCPCIKYSIIHKQHTSKKETKTHNSIKDFALHHIKNGCHSFSFVFPLKIQKFMRNQKHFSETYFLLRVSPAVGEPITEPKAAFSFSSTKPSIFNKT